MCKFWDRMTGNVKSSAKIVDGTLILSLPDAVDPVVWRWELGEVKASALEVKEAENGHFKLILKTPRGIVQDVAPFDSRKKAVDALLRVSDAMENAPRVMAKVVSADAVSSDVKVANMNAGRKQGDGIKVLLGIGAIFLMVSLFVWMGNLTPRRLDATIDPAAASATLNTAPQESGVPMSAEDYLNGM